MAPISQSSRRSGSSSGSVRSASSSTDDGRYDRNWRVRSNASCSLSTTSLTVPLWPWMWAPPSSSLVTVSPRWATSGGPATKTCEMSLHHQRVVAGDDPGRAEPGDRAEGQRDDGHGGQVGDDPLPARVGRDVRVAGVLERLDRAAAAGAVDEAHDRHPVLVGELLGHHLLGGDRRVGRPAAHREVVAADDDRAAVERRPGPSRSWPAGSGACRRPAAPACRRWPRSRGTTPGRRARRCARAP